MLELENVLYRKAYFNRNYTYLPLFDLHPTLSRLSQCFNLILYTRLERTAAETLLKEQGLEKLFSQTRFQNDCIKHPADGFIKDLAYVSDIDMLRTIQVDTKDASVQLNRQNSIVLLPDEHLGELVDYLEGIVMDGCPDVRKELEHNQYTEDCFD